MRLERLRAWAYRLRRDVVALWLGVSDAEVPWHAKIVAVIVAGYALSPIDLIPDFVPVLGYLDDVLLIPLGIALALRLIPPQVMKRLRAEAEGAARPKAYVAGAMILALWVGIGAWASILLLEYD